MPIVKHYHHCPVCYEHWKCDANCTIEPDLEDRGKQFGAHCTCPECDVMIAHEDIYYSAGNSKYSTKEFWDVYNGFVKVRKIVIVKSPLDGIANQISINNRLVEKYSRGI